MSDQDGAAPRPPLTVQLDVPSARVLADQAGVIQDLQFVMESCRRLLTELDKPEAERDSVVPVALWSAALVAYARCFSSGQLGLSADDLASLTLKGEVLKFHKWVIEERNRHTRHVADPFEAATVGAVLAPADSPRRAVQGITVLAARHVLVNATGVRQLGALASELARQTADRAKDEQDTVLAAAQEADLDQLYARPPLTVGPEDGPEDGDGPPSA